MRWLRTDSAWWLAIAAVLFATSFALTLHVTWVDRADPLRVLTIEVRGDPHARRPAIAITPVEGDHFGLTIQDLDPRVGHLRFGPFSEAAAARALCASYSIRVSHPVDADDAEGHWYQGATFARFFRPFSARIVWLDIDVASIDPAPHLLIECTFPTSVENETYVSRSLRVVTLGGPLAGGTISLDDRDPSIQVTSEATGETRLASADTAAPTSDGVRSLRFTWDSLQASQRRDLLLIIIGTLIALAAAATIEAARPYIDIVTRRENAQTSVSDDDVT
jgi:hypothetical protein